MTIDKSKTVVVPQWLLTLIISVTTISFGLWGGKAIMETKINRAEYDIQCLQKEKVSRNEFELVIKAIDKLEKKIDDLKDE